MDGYTKDMAWAGTLEDWRKDDLSVNDPKIIALMQKIGISGDTLGLTNQKRLLSVLTSYVEHNCDAVKEAEVRRQEEEAEAERKRQREEEEARKRNNMPLTVAQIEAMNEQEQQRLAAEEKRKADEKAEAERIASLMAESSILNRTHSTMDCASKTGCFHGNYRIVMLGNLRYKICNYCGADIDDDLEETEREAREQAERDQEKAAAAAVAAGPQDPEELTSLPSSPEEGATTSTSKGDDRITSPDAVVDLNLHAQHSAVGSEPTPLAL